MLIVEQLCIAVGGPKRHRLMVENVNLAVETGRPLTIIGETGSGKSLVARAILNRLPQGMQASGRIGFQGRNLLTMESCTVKRLWGRKIFLFPQEPTLALDPTMVAVNQVKEIFQWVRGFGRKPALKIAARFMDASGLDSDRNARAYPHQLSGGMRQRLLAAMAMAEPADLVVADEPTKGLDTKRRSSMVAMLESLVRKGKALLTITHDLEVARMLGGWIAVMYGGQIVEQGPGSQLLDSPLHPYTKALLRALPANGLNPIPYKVNGSRQNHGCVFAERCILATEVCFERKPASKWTPGKRQSLCFRGPC